METAKNILTAILLLVVIVRCIILGVSADFSSTNGIYFIIRHMIYTFAWFSLLRFAFEMYFMMSEEQYKYYVTNMKKVSLMAMVACLLKFVVTAVYQFQYRNDYNNLLSKAYVVIELLAWLMLTVFFCYYWRMMKREQNSVIESEQEEQEDAEEMIEV